MQRDRGQCFIQVEAAVIDRMRAMRRPGESYSHIILRLVELEKRAFEGQSRDNRIGVALGLGTEPRP
jgi:hypothetical protein